MSYQFLMITDVLSGPLAVLSTVRRQVPDHQGLGRAVISVSLESCREPRENGTWEDPQATNAHQDISRRLSRNSGWRRPPSLHWPDRMP